MRLLVVVDSLDESPEIFGTRRSSDDDSSGGSSVVGAAAPETPQRLQNLLRAVTADLLPLSQGHTGVIFHVFVPTLTGFDFNATTRGLRKDKIFTRHLAWTAGDLLNYADVQLGYMRDHSAWFFRRCRLLPSFSELVGGPAEAERVLCTLRNPRNLAQFFRTLTERLKSVCALRGDAPFIATPADVDAALANAEIRLIFDSKDPLPGCNDPANKRERAQSAAQAQSAKEPGAQGAPQHPADEL